MAIILMVILGFPINGPCANVTYYFDANAGNNENLCSMGSPCQTIEKAIALVESRRTNTDSTTLFFAPGAYGDFVWTLPGSFNGIVAWVSQDANDPARLNSLWLEGTDVHGNQVFDGFEIQTPHGTNNGDAVVLIVSVDKVEIKNSKIWNEDLYDRFGGFKIVANEVVVRNCVIHDVISAIRFNGDNHKFIGNEIYRYPGSAISTLCGGLDDRAQSARNILIEGNVIHSQRGDYPSEPGWNNYDEPDELHASIIAIRGSDYAIKDNWVFDTSEETVNIQFYAGDCGVSNYLIENIVITDNIFYSLMSSNTLIQATEAAVGSVMVERNTIVGKSLYVHFWENGYDGAGSVMRDNIVYGEFGGMLQENYVFLPNAVIENNLAIDAFWGLPKGDNLTDSHVVFKDDQTFWDNQLFLKPDYSKPNTKFMKPKGTDEGDWTPLASGLACTTGGQRGYIGAIPCTGVGDVVAHSFVKKAYFVNQNGHLLTVIYPAIQAKVGFFISLLDLNGRLLEKLAFKKGQAKWMVPQGLSGVIVLKFNLGKDSFSDRVHLLP